MGGGGGESWQPLGPADTLAATRARPRIGEVFRQAIVTTNRLNWSASVNDLRHPFFIPIARRKEPTAPDLRVVAAAGYEAEIYLYDPIGGWDGISASEFRDELAAVTAPRIALHINSPGGDVFDAIAIYNMLRTHPAKVTSYVDAIAASAASVIALAGQRIVMAQHSQMMIHDAWGWATGNSAAMHRAGDFLARQSDIIAGIYAGRGKTAAHWRALMEAETWFTAEEAVAAGLADEVSEQEAVENRFDLSAFRNAPKQQSTNEIAHEHLRFQRTRARLAGVDA